MTKGDYKYQTARNVIRQRPFSKELNFTDIIHNTHDIQADCTDVQWADDQLEDILGNELAAQFRLQYSDLETSIQRFLDEVDEYRYDWTLNNGEERGGSYMDAMIAASGGVDDLMILGDGDEQEYTPLWGFLEDYYERTAAARIKALTKDKIVELVGDVIWIVKNYMDIKVRFQLISGVFDLIREEACHELDVVKGVEAAWESWQEQKNEDADKKFRDAVSQLPDDVWVY